eukprot:696252-Karenia_brevis.AAC.1
MLALKASPFVSPSPSSCHPHIHYTDAELRNGFGLMARNACLFVFMCTGIVPDHTTYAATMDS